MVKYPLQRFCGDGATQLAIEVGEQVGVRDLQDPYSVVATFSGRLNRRSS